MANCPHCDYATSPEGDEEPQEKLKEHLLSSHRGELRRSKEPHDDLDGVAGRMAQKALNRGRK